MVSSKSKKRLTYFTLGAFYFTAGVEYAVILPSAWLYLHTHFNAPEYFLGLLLSFYSIAGMLSGPILGRWADKSRHVRLILIVAVLFEMVGSFMYFLGFSTWFLVSSRFISGLGVGGLAVIMAELARFTTEEERTGVFSIFIAVRQSGLLLGPGFNFFLTKLDFYLGPFLVDRFTSPGLLMTLIWSIMVIFLLTIFWEPEKLFRDMEVMAHLESSYEHDEENLYTAVTPTSPPVMYDEAYTEPRVNSDIQIRNGAINTNMAGSLGDTEPGVTSDIQIRNGASNSDTHVAGSLGNTSTMNVSVGSVGSVTSSVFSSHLMESAERMMQSDSASSREKISTIQNGPKKRRKELTSSSSHSTTSVNGHSKKKEVSRDSVGLKFFYDEYVREEIVVLLGVQFMTIFTQVALETMLTPITQTFLDFDEFENSLLYCGAGVQIILVFIVTHKLSRRVEDRYLIAFGCVVITIANCWGTYLLPTLSQDTRLRTLLGLIAAIFLDMIGLPFLMVCASSLFSKLTGKETQGMSQGIRRSTLGLAQCLAPLWAGSTIRTPYILMGVLLALLLFSQVLFFMSFSKLKVPKKDNQQQQQQQQQQQKQQREEEESERQPLLR